MKKLYTILLSAFLTFYSINANATTWTVMVGGSSTVFSPSSFSVAVGDLVNFQWATGNTLTHNVSTVTVPAGAQNFSSGDFSTAGHVYPYNVTVLGTYVFRCTFHGAMAGTFSAGTAGIVDPAVNYFTSAYPTPCTDKITFKYNSVDKIELFNLLGENVRTVGLTANEGKVDVDFSDMTAGIYFFRTYREGLLLETKKIIKAK